MKTFNQLQAELHKAMQHLPLVAADPFIRQQVAELRWQEMAFVRAVPRGIGNSAGITPAVAPALPLTPVLAELLWMLLQAIAAALLAIGALILLFFLAAALEPTLASLVFLLNHAIEWVKEARNRVQEMERSHPRASHCSPLFDPVITILKTMVTRLHSPPARQPNLTFYKGLSQLAEKLSDALDDLIGCLDPGDSSGIRRVFFGPNGLIERALRQIRNLVGR